jgi:SAM-dependent methyltransferase
VATLNEVVGAIENITFKDGHLLVGGWVASLDSRPIAEFRVSSRHMNLPGASWEYGIPNRAGKAGVGRANCGFRIRAPIGAAGGARSRDLLVSVTALVAKARSRSLFAILKPSLPIPRWRDWAMVGGSFFPDACNILGSLVSDARLARNETVLDIGCGVGRIAYVLSYYLSRAGRYEGLEPVKRWVRRNQAVVGARFRNFRFKTLAIHNPVYNSKGALEPSSVRFPYPDGTFDLAIASSVFQHNRAATVRHYLGEIERVLRPSGRCLVTCFLLGAKPPSGLPKKSPLRFVHPVKGGWTATPDLPEFGIAFLERDFRRWAARHRLIVRTKFDGAWHNRGPSNFYQDMVILQKPGVRRSSDIFQGSRVKQKLEHLANNSD